MNIHEAVGELLKVTEEEMLAANGPAENPPAVVEKPEITPELVDSLISENPELADCDKEMLLKGMTIEIEHFDSVGGDIITIAKVACDHIKEFPGKDYYAALEQMEHELAETPEAEKAEQTSTEEDGSVETETPAGEANFVESKVVEGKKEDKAAAETAASITKTATSLLRKIHKASDLTSLEDIMNNIEKDATKGKINAEQETRLKSALGRRKDALKENPKAPETAPTEAEEKSIEECVVEEKKEPKESEEVEAKKAANKKEEDKINKKEAAKK
jgi:hypothetical protein